MATDTQKFIPQLHIRTMQKDMRQLRTGAVLESLPKPIVALPKPPVTPQPTPPPAPKLSTRAPETVTLKPLTPLTPQTKTQASEQKIVTPPKISIRTDETQKSVSVPIKPAAPQQLNPPIPPKPTDFNQPNTKVPVPPAPPKPTPPAPQPPPAKKVSFAESLSILAAKHQKPQRTFTDDIAELMKNS